MRLHLFIFLALLLFSCDPEKRSQRRIASLEKAGPGRKYEVGLACMDYLARHANDLAYSKTLVKKLLAASFFMEAIHGVERLLEKYPSDAELFYLRSIALRNQHQYPLAMDDLGRALDLQPDNADFTAELQKLKSESGIWRDIGILDRSLVSATDSFSVLLHRAEKFFLMQQYDAALYDLGALSKMGLPKDSLYFTQSVRTLYRESRPVDVLSEMLAYFRALRE